MKKIILQITGLSEAIEAVCVNKFTHIISLFSYYGSENLDFHTSAKHHKQFFDDLESGTTAPTIAQVQEILEFSESLMENDSLLIHCYAGISRSTATALGIMVQHGYKDREALKYLLQIRPLALPNFAILGHVDELLGSQLKPLVSEWNKSYRPPLF